MKLPLLLFTALICGCSTPQLCKTINIVDHSNNCLENQCVDYLKEKPTGYKESSHGYAIPFMNSKWVIKKGKNDLIFSCDDEIGLGLVTSLTSTEYFDLDGKRKEKQCSKAELLNGLLAERVKTNSSSGSYDNLNILSGLLYSSKSFVDTEGNTEHSKTSYFLNSFGSYSEGNTDYIKLFWIPLEIKN